MTTATLPRSDTFTDLLDVVEDPLSPGRFTATASSDWTVVHVHGGVLMALAARMAERSRPSPSQVVTAVHALYLRPIPAGSLTGEVTWLRVGRSASQADVDLFDADGQLAVRVLVVISEPRPGSPTSTTSPRPGTALDVGAATQAVGSLIPADGSALPFHRRHTWLSAEPGHAWDAPSPVGEPGRTFDSWFRLHDTPTAASGEVDPLVLCLAADSIGPAATEALDLWASDRHLVLPTLEMDLQLFAVPASGWILQHAEIHHVADGLLAASVHLYDERDCLVGLATQRAAVRFF